MANEQTEQQDEVEQVDSGDRLNMSHDQLMELLNHVAEQRNLPVASSTTQSPFQKVQPPQQPAPVAQPIAANVPQTGKVLDQASGAWIRPDTAASVAKFRQQGEELQQQDAQKAQQQAQQGGQGQNSWQQMYGTLKQQNPRATPQELLMTMKAFKDAGAFAGTSGLSFDQRKQLLETRDADSMSRLKEHGVMAGDVEDAKNKSDIAAAAPKKAGETAGAESTKIAQTINDQADAAAMANMQLKHISELSKDIKMGKMAGANQLASSWAQAWGLMDQKQADATFGSAGSAQALTKAVLPLVSQMTKALTSRPAVFEFQQFMKSNPNIEQTPDGFEKVVSFMIRLNELAIDKQKYFREWKKTHGVGDYQDFSSDWNQKVIAESGDKIPAENNSEEPTSTPQAKVINYSDWN